MKRELILIVWLRDNEGSRIESICDPVGAQFGFTKRSAGILPNGRPVGYIYSKAGDIFQCLMLHAGPLPHDKIHAMRADEAVCNELKVRAITLFGTSVQIVGESNRSTR